MLRSHACAAEAAAVLPLPHRRRSPAQAAAVVQKTLAGRAEHVLFSAINSTLPSARRPLTGGAQDVANFRENVAAGKLPLPSDVTFEGLCKEYYFDTSSR